MPLPIHDWYRRGLASHEVPSDRRRGYRGFVAMRAEARFSDKVTACLGYWKPCYGSGD
jgi:hypothetical protein